MNYFPIQKKKIKLAMLGMNEGNGHPYSWSIIINGKYNAKVRLYLPHDFNENRKYPLLVNVYAGPNSQQVNDRCVLNNIYYFSHLTKWQKINLNGF